MPDWPSASPQDRISAESEADAALAVIRAHCLELMREIRGRVHLTDPDHFVAQIEQRALVAWQIAEDCNTSAHIAGEVWPYPNGGRYNMHMRVHIPFGLSPRDPDEFWRGVWVLKAMSDAATEGGL